MALSIVENSQGGQHLADVIMAATNLLGESAQQAVVIKITVEATLPQAL